MRGRGGRYAAAAALLALSAASALAARELVGVAEGERPSSLAADALGTNEDAWNEALRTLAQARAARAVAPAYRLRIQALGELEPLTRRGPAHARARAGTLAAVVAAELATLDREHGKSYVARALGGLRQAVAVDPGAEDAAFDLELLLQPGSARRPRERPAQSGANGVGRSVGGGRQPAPTIGY